VKGEWVIPMPPGLDAAAAMALGTAGFTAAYAIHRMEQNGQTPERGPIVVTGASGGVGSIAIDMLAGRGYQVVAVSGKASSSDYLQTLGAATILLRQEIDFGSRPLEAARFAGAIDNVGGEMLTWLTRTVDFWGNIASIGLAGSAELKTTVMPFILRGVSLLGINSGATPRPARLEVWKRIATDLRPRHLDRIVTRTISFDDLPGAFAAYLDGTVTGRTVVKIAK
jgi:NADPH2:quinone reductase